MLSIAGRGHTSLMVSGNLQHPGRTGRLARCRGVELRMYRGAPARRTVVSRPGGLRYFNAMAWLTSMAGGQYQLTSGGRCIENTKAAFSMEFAGAALG